MLHTYIRTAQPHKAIGHDPLMISRNVKTLGFYVDARLTLASDAPGLLDASVSRELSPDSSQSVVQFGAEHLSDNARQGQHPLSIPSIGKTRCGVLGN